MAILISTTVKGQTQEGYDQVSAFLHEVDRYSPGFISHCSFASDQGWAVLEIWQTKIKQQKQMSAQMILLALLLTTNKKSTTVTV